MDILVSRSVEKNQSPSISWEFYWLKFWLPLQEFAYTIVPLLLASPKLGYTGKLEVVASI